MQTYRETWNICGHEIYELDSIVDFDYRREEIIAKNVDTRVLLWMVVSVTISGVLLAGLQLLASYKLASSGKDEFAQVNQLSLERGNLH